MRMCSVERVVQWPKAAWSAREFGREARRETCSKFYLKDRIGGFWGRGTGCVNELLSCLIEIYLRRI